MDQARQAEAAWAGWALVAAAAVTLLAMSHHPSSAHASALNMGVHGVMIALSAVAGYGFFARARLRGLHHPAVAAGLVAYALALVANVGAALVNGFVVTALVAQMEPGAPHDMMHFAWELNQALAGLGVITTGAAYALWGIDLLRRGDRAEQTVGGLGLIAGIVPAASLAAGLLRMNLHGAMIAYGAQMAWMACAGLLLLRRARGMANLREEES